ncbi:MAG TPA: hypothetical protein VGN55_19410 [Xanthobacteraceae bacterium]|jgi:ElaB/YqjD/DUF883 family membrane-anchored ribosome-binding protein
MFHQRSSAFAPSISAIEGRLRALEGELERVGRKAGRRASANASAAGDHIGDAIASAVTEIVDRFRSGRRLAGDEAMRFGNEAAKFGAKFGNDALERVASEVEHRPLVTLAVAVGVGILIGMVGGAAKRR